MRAGKPDPLDAVDRTDGTQKVPEERSGAAATIAIGTCATWGGVPSAEGNPTGAMSLPREILIQAPSARTTVTASR